MEKCADWLGCDGYEQPSVGDTIVALAGSGNYKSQVCAVSGLLYNGGKIAGFAYAGLLGLIIGNNIGQALECLYVWMKSGSAKKKAEKYHICLDERSQGHPLPYTDRQIAKLLDLMNKLPTVENIVAAYDKLCVRDNYGRYDFLPRGTVFDDVIIDHAPGYIYVLCASVYSACPCIYNIQHGTLEEPDYIKDENGVIVMENGELQMRNKETYQKRYAKHCRVMRFRDLYEQTNDLPNIFHFSCNDMVGYSKGKLPITAPIVQCIEGTARNIFEMPILGHTYITTYKENTIDYYKNDYKLVNDIVTGIENVIGVDKNGNIRRTQSDINARLARDFTIPERIKIYHLLRDLWTKENAVKIEYTVGAGGNCISNGYRKYAFTQSNVTFLDKYFDNPSVHPMMFCCDSEFQTKVDNTSAYSCSGIPPVCRDPVKHDYSGVKVCERDDDITTDRNNTSPKKGKKFIHYFNGSLSRTFDKEDSQIDATTFPTTDIFEYYEEAKEFRDGLKEKYQTISRIYNAVDGTEFQERNFKLEYTLFDIFRNRIKAVAGIFLVLWLFIIGWKFINGDTKLLKPDEFLKMFVKMALCWLIVFDDGAKNQLFRLVMQVAQGSVTAVDGVFGTIRDKKNNLVEKACSFGNDIAYSAVTKDKGFGPIGSDGRCNQDFPACLPPAGKTLAESDLPGKCYGVVEGGQCHYYGLTCELNGVVQPKAFHCERHLVRDGVITDVCLQGHCDTRGVDFIPVPPFSRPYKYYVRKDRTATSTAGIRELKPKCCDSGSIGNKCDSETEPRQIYSQSLNQAVYVCPSGKKMSAGYKLADLIQSGIIEDKPEDKRPFFQLYNEQMHPSPLLKKGDIVPSDIGDLIVPTSVADIDINGRVVDLDFVDANQGTDLYQRFQYSKYLVSKVNAANAKANYPNIVENGFWHNYAHIGFWDKIDCKIIQYLTFSMSGNGLDNTLADAVEHMKTGDDDALVTDLLNGLLQVAKFLILAFPFGVIAFCLFLALGVVMFMMLARATQKYCVCIFNLVLTIYLSPIVFIMYLFDATKKAMTTFIDDIKANVTGSITPFITLSLFLFVLDWLMFGDEDKYITEHMFSGNGVSSECYDGNESDAPIACLTRKLLDRFKLVAIFQMFIGRGPMVSGLTYKMMWFLLLKLLVALVIFMIMMGICDAIESSIQGMIGAEPDTKIGVGFEGKASEAYKSGIDAFKESASTIGSIYKNVGKGIYNAVKGIAGGGKGKNTQTNENNSGQMGEHQSGYNQGFNDGSNRSGFIGREGTGGLNALGTGGANMNNMFGQGGGQSGKGGGLDDIGSQFDSMFGRGNNFIGRRGAQSGIPGNPMNSGGQNDYLQGYNKGFSDGSSRSGGAGGNKSGGGQQGFTGAVKELFNSNSTKGVGSRLADVGKAAGNGIIKGANATIDGLVNYGDFVSKNMRRLRQEQAAGQKLQEEQNNAKDNNKSGESGTNSNQNSSHEETYGVGSDLLDNMRAKAVSDYMQNKGANRSGVPKDSNDDGRDDKGKSKWNLFGGLMNLPSFGGSRHGAAASKSDQMASGYSAQRTDFVNQISNNVHTQNIKQQTNTSKETQITNETVKGQDKVNVKETRVYVKGNNGNKNNNDN